MSCIWRRQDFGSLRITTVTAQQQEQDLDTYLSFLVRVWITRRQSCEEIIRSDIQLIQSGETWQFSQFEEALRFLEQLIRSTNE